MPKPGSAEIIVVLDRSTSMFRIARDMEVGFDRLIAEQRSVPGECRVTLHQFDTLFETVYENRLVAEVPPLKLELRPGTALLDALGDAIDMAGQRLDGMHEGDKPEKVIVVVITDGEENSSRRRKRVDVANAVEHQTTKYSWQFIYLGANVDAFAEASSLGIRTSSHYISSRRGTRRMTETTSAALARYRREQSRGVEMPEKIPE